jgi:hypothetical protein
VGLVENNVGGLIESSQGALQEEEEPLSATRYESEEGAGVMSGGLLTTMLRPSFVMTEITSAEQKKEEKIIITNSDLGILRVRERDSRSTSDSSAGPPDAILSRSRGGEDQVPPPLLVAGIVLDAASPRWEGGEEGGKTLAPVWLGLPSDLITGP